MKSVILLAGFPILVYVVLCVALYFDQRSLIYYPQRGVSVAGARFLRLPTPQVAVMGRSLGSGVAVWLASQRPVSQLILVTPFNSLQEIAAAQFPYFPVRWLLLDRYESWRFAPAVKVPTLTLEAEKDEVIPAASTQALAGHFRPGLVTLKILSDARHNTISDHPEYVELLREFGESINQ